jgi:hypothetical protein
MALVTATSILPSFAVTRHTSALVEASQQRLAVVGSLPDDDGNTSWTQKSGGSAQQRPQCGRSSYYEVMIAGYSLSDVAGVQSLEACLSILPPRPLCAGVGTFIGRPIRKWYLSS